MPSPGCRLALTSTGAKWVRKLPRQRDSNDRPLSLSTLPGGVAPGCGRPLPPQRDATLPKEGLRVLRYSSREA